MAAVGDGGAAVLHGSWEAEGGGLFQVTDSERQGPGVTDSERQGPGVTDSERQGPSGLCHVTRPAT